MIVEPLGLALEFILGRRVEETFLRDVARSTQTAGASLLAAPLVALTRTSLVVTGAVTTAALFHLGGPAHTIINNVDSMSICALRIGYLSGVADLETNRPRRPRAKPGAT